MKKSKNICQSLGLKQWEMAMVLGITRAQWSMYESGQRELPHHASMLLTELLAHVNKLQTTTKNKGSAEIEPELKQHLETLLRENEYQSAILERKIIAFEKKQAAHIQSTHVIDYITQHNAKRKKANEPLLRQPASKASKTLDDARTALDYEIRRELLEYENKLLKSKLEKE